MAVKYHNQQFNPEKLSKHHIDRMALEEVRPGSFVLDIGCATGFMGKYLKRKKHCTVIGVEMREAEARIAKQNLDSVIIGNIEEPGIEKQILRVTQKKKFDCILATSVIEHLANPDAAIQRLLPLLRPTGVLIMSTPNIAHWSTRFDLLRGNFTYTDYGILDSTHLHLFTMKSFRQLFEKQGLHIVKIKVDAEGGGYPRISLALAPFFPTVFAYQMLIIATKSGGHLPK